MGKNEIWRKQKLSTSIQVWLPHSIQASSSNKDSLEDDKDLYLDDVTSVYPILKDCEINLYPKTYLRGAKTTITMNSTVTDLSLYSFNDKLKSLEVKGPCCWVIFAYKHFRGPSKQFCKGKFKSSTMIGADLVGEASSLKISVSRISKISDYN